jgi:FkbM family methyltransferase
MYYSQFEEDKFIEEYCRNYGIKLHKTCIEIGASDGKTISNIRYFCLNGFKGIYVEPIPIRYEEIKKNTQGQDCIILNNAVVPEGTDKEVKFKIEPSFDFSHIDNDNYNLIVRGIYWSEIIKCIQEVGILSIDIEGFETPILKDVLKSRIRPQFIIIESNLTTERTNQMKMLLRSNYYLMKMKSKNNVWMDSRIFTPEQDNAVYNTL